MKKTTWPGNWKVTCDVCGRWYPSGEMKHRWDGLIVCEKDFETRHPQTLIKVRAETSVPSFVRKDPIDEFTGYCDVVSNSGYAGLAGAGCAQAGNSSIPYLVLVDLFLNGHE